MIGMIYHTHTIISYITIIYNKKFVRGWLVDCLSVGTEPECLSPKGRYLTVPKQAETEREGSPRWIRTINLAVNSRKSEFTDTIFSPIAWVDIS